MIEGSNVSYLIIEGFKIQSPSVNSDVTYEGFNNPSYPIPKMNAAILFRNGDNITVRYNHTYKSGISGIIFMPKDTTSCPDTLLPGSTNIFYFDTACGIQNSGNKVLSNKVELANQGRDYSGTLSWAQESLTMWGVTGNFEVAYNLIIDGTKEGLDIKLGRNGTVHHNTIRGVGTGISVMNILENGVGIYLDGRREKMFNIKIYNNIVSNNKKAGITVLTERPVASPVNNIYDIEIYNNLIHGNGSTGLVIGDRVGSTNGTIDVEVYHNTLADNFKTFMLKTFYDPDLKPGWGTVKAPVTTCTAANVPPVYYTGGTVTNITNTDNIINCSTQVTTANPNPVKFVSLSSSTYFLGLQSTSPAINVGDTNTGPAPTDFDGFNRTTSPDMGAYEYH